MKKILSLVLVAAMMLSLVALAPTASAETGVSIEVTDAVAVQGDTVSLDIIITGTTLRSFGLVVDYDATRLENGSVAINIEDGLVDGGTIAGFDYAGTTFTGNIKGDSLDISAGYHLATITLSVKDDAPAGDAYVRVSTVPDTNGMIYVGPTDKSSEDIYDWTVIDGNVTVLPEGYAAAPVVPGDDLWDFEDGVIYGYLGDTLTGDIAIPSQIGGVDVVEIAAAALDGFEVTSVVIPATVELIAAGAFYNLASCTDIYVLNPDCELEDAAMGYEGSWRSGKLRNAAIILTEEETVLLTIHGIAGSTAQTYAEAGDGVDVFPWVEYVAPTTVTVVADGNTSSFEVSDNTIVAPGASRVDGRVTVAWDVNGTKVAPGAEVAIDGDTTFTAITVAAPETTYGASVKAADEYAALRFTASFATAEYDALVTAFGAESVKHGMLISTQDQIEAAGEFTHNLAKKIDFEMKGCYKVEDGNYVFAASVKNFSASTLANNYKFNAVAYVGIDLDDDGTVDTYVYGDYDWTCARDAKTVLTNAIEDTANSGLVGDQITWAENWLAKFN